MTEMWNFAVCTGLYPVHNMQLIPEINKLYDSNFIRRMLYKDLY